jgi:hypothetical protein
MKKPKIEKITVKPVLLDLRPENKEGTVSVEVEIRVTPKKWELVPVRYLEIELHLGEPVEIRIPIEVVEEPKHGERRS